MSGNYKVAKVNVRMMALASVITLGGCVSTASTVTTEFYSVRGSTGAQIDKELRRKGPMSGHALASAAISFQPVSVTQEETTTSCKFKTAKFKVNANITLPRWQDRAQSDDRQLRRNWDGLAKYAKLHEQTHVKIAEAFAKLLGSELMALPAEKSCARLDRKAKKAIATVSAKHNAAQKQFDAREQARLTKIFREAERQAAKRS